MDDPADQRSVFPDFAAAKGCPSEKVLCGQSGFLQNIFRVSTNNMTRLSWMKRFWISRWYTKWIILVLEPQNGHSSSFLPDCIWKMTFPIRGFCIGKKNRVMIDTVAGAMSSAIIYSIAETAKANSLKPYDYFEYLLTGIPKHLDDTDRAFPDDLLPWSPNLPANCRKPGKEEMK